MQISPTSDRACRFTWIIDVLPHEQELAVGECGQCQSLPIGQTQGAQNGPSQLLKALELFRTAGGKKTEERFKVAQEIFKIIVDEQLSIGTVGQSPATMGVRIVSRRMGNIASRQINAQHCRTPCSSHPATLIDHTASGAARVPARRPAQGKAAGRGKDPPRPAAS